MLDPNTSRSTARLPQPVNPKTADATASAPTATLREVDVLCIFLPFQLFIAGSSNSRPRWRRTMAESVRLPEFFAALSIGVVYSATDGPGNSSAPDSNRLYAGAAKQRLTGRQSTTVAASATIVTATNLPVLPEPRWPAL